ncbi:MAG: DUF4395 family protein [Chloroflexi bacterium]|nr:DUF4395 family protein [Chloroflexota bacterium]
MPHTVSRTADPYRDLDVIDARAPRFNQATVGLLSLAAVLSGWWPILALLAAQLGIGLRFGRRYCMPCLVYFELLQPIMGEGPIEDARPPRFANQVGFVFLSAASVAYGLSLGPVGVTLGGLVAALALLAASTGLCAGCQLYRLGARLRGIAGRRLDRVELGDIGPIEVDGGLIVAFSHPLCTDCLKVEAALRAAGRRYVRIDVRERPDLARKYGIALVPTLVEVAASGAVVGRIAA